MTPNKIPKNIRFTPQCLAQIQDLIDWQKAKDRTHAIEIAIDRFHTEARQKKPAGNGVSLKRGSGLAEVSKYLGDVIAMSNGSMLNIIEPSIKAQIVELDLSGKSLTHLPPEIKQLPNLKRLDLSFNQLTTLPPEIGQLKQLSKLYLHDNKLTTLPSEIGQLTNLMRLHFYNNNLTNLPPEIGQLINLLSLYMSRNQLQTLPLEIGQLTNLQWLDLSHNQLTELPAELGQLTNLSRFYFNNNQFSLPHEITQQGIPIVLAYLRGLR